MKPTFMPATFASVVLAWPALDPSSPVFAQAGNVQSYQKISSSEGGFTGALSDSDLFGAAVANIGDLDDDGVVDLAVGAPGDDTGGPDRGALWILFLQADGTVKGSQKIDAQSGGFAGSLDDFDSFGFSVAVLGDLNGDNVEDIAVGAPKDDDGGTDRGAIWILFLRTDGVVWAQWKISTLSGGFGGGLDDADEFGHAVAGAGDLDSDGVGDIAVGTPFDDDGYRFFPVDRGAIWILFMAANGTVRQKEKISETSGGFPYELSNGAAMGSALTSAGDLDHDGVGDIVVQQSTSCFSTFLLRPDGTLKQFPLGYCGASRFGDGLAALGDIDRDGAPDLLAGVPSDSSGVGGTAWAIFDYYQYVRGVVRIGAGLGGFSGILDSGDSFGSSVASLGDLNGDGLVDVVVGAKQDDDGGQDRGALWVLFLDCSTASASVRNNSGINPGTLFSSTPPMLGATWSIDLNCIGHDPALSFLIVRGAPASGILIGSGEVLVGGQHLFLRARPHSGGVERFSEAVPNDTALCGLHAYCQGLCLGSPGAQLSNAVDIVLGQ